MSENSGSYGIGVGTVIAMLLSWFKWYSVWWLIPAGIFGWFYVVYYLIRYGVAK